MNQRAIAGTNTSPGALVVPALVIIGSAIVGLVAAGYEVLALLAPLGLLTAYLLFTRPFLGLLLVVVTLPLENALDLGEFTATKLLAAGVALAWGLGKMARRESFHRVFRTPVFRYGVLLVVFALLSSLWAERSNAALVGSIRLGLVLAFGLLAIDVTTSEDRFRWIVRTMMLGGLLGGFLTLLLYASGGASRAGEEVAGVNGTAMLMVTFFPLAYLTVVGEDRPAWKLVGTAFLVVAVATVGVTFSRMSMLVLPLVLGVCAWQSIRLRRGRRWLVVLGLGAVVLFALLVPRERFLERARSIGPYVESTFGGADQTDEPLSGRGFHHLVGLYMFADHPVLGVGYNNYGYQFLWKYQLEVSGGHKLWESQRSPHSSHIGMLAEIGLLGTALWALLLLAPLVLLWRARHRLRGREVNYVALSAFFVAFAYILQIGAYAWYTPTQKEKAFWVLLALVTLIPALVLQGEPANEELLVDGPDS
jgi:O-antigen ligase